MTAIRVPMVIVSPFARPAFTDDATASLNSVLAYVEHTFGLSPLSKAVVKPPAGVEGVTAKDLQQQLASAEALYKQQKYDDAVTVYRAILRGAPSMAIVNLQIGAAYRSTKDKGSY